MTPAEVIANVLILLERPDLESVAKSRFYTALKSAHKVARLRQDLRIGYITNPSIDSASGRLTYVVDDVTPRLREFRSVSLYKQYTESTPGIIVPTESSQIYVPAPGFVDIVDKVEVSDYFGYKVPYTYSLMGNIATLSGVSSDATCIKIVYLGNPTYVYDEATEEYSSDSWILRDHGALVEAFLRWYLADVIDAPSAKQAAASELQFQSAEFVAEKHKDIIED